MLDSPTHPDRCCLTAAAAIALSASANLALAITTDSGSITAPASRAPASPGVLSASPARAESTIASLSLSSDTPDVPVTTQAGTDADGATNFRGEKVVAAPVRYVEDFESGQIGPEWGAFGGTLADESLTTFANPAAGGLVLNVKTESDSAYEIRLDIYLISSANAEAESADTSLSVFVDEQAVMQLTPASLRELSGKKPEPGRPLTRTIRVPFTAAHPIAELRFEAAGDAAGISWGIDNLVIDLGLQDPVYGITGGGGYDPGTTGLLDPGAGLTGELQPLPKSRYGSNEPFAGDGPGGGSPRTPPFNPNELDRNDDGVLDDVEEETDEVPAPATSLLVMGAIMTAARRRRRAVVTHH